MFCPARYIRLIHNYKLNDEVMLNWALTRVFITIDQGDVTTIVTDAEAGYTSCPIF
jgi:beta-galactosidase